LNDILPIKHHFSALFSLLLPKISQKSPKKLRDPQTDLNNLISFYKIMVIYQCERCLFLTNDKNKYTRHCNRKFICKKSTETETLANIGCSKSGKKSEKIDPKRGFLGDVPQEKIPKMDLLGSPIDQVTTSKKSEKVVFKKKSGHKKSELTQIDLQIDNTENQKIQKNERKFSCKWCGKGFFQNGHMHRHTRKCSIRSVYESNNDIESSINQAINEKFDLLKEKILEKVKSHQSITNNTINITINAYGKEDMSYLNIDILKRLISGFSATTIPKLIKDIHCNPSHPENMNLYKPNKKDEYIMVFNGSGWRLDQSKKIIDQLIYDKCNFLDHKIDQFNLFDKSQKFQEVQENVLDDDDEKRKMSDRITIDLYNNRYFISNKEIFKDMK